VPIRVFEIACVVIVVATLAAMTRRTPARPLLADYALLASAAWLGEESCVAIYRFYAYGAQWDARFVDVPVLVPLIWPLVILSARDVATGLFPRASGLARAAIVGAIVAFDASMVEVVAVRAGLWSWAERGHFEVPLIGILGWGYFALGADLVLARAKGAALLPVRVLVLAVAPLVAHALIQATWWGLFRWTLRGDLGRASLVGFVVLAALGSAIAARAKRRGDGIPLGVAGPRVLAAGLFFVLLVRVAPRDLGLWTQVACVAVTYSIATRWRSVAGVTSA
jgi:hypothetical protein